MREFETTRNVFIGVDIQKDFISGSLAVNEGDKVVQPANELAEAVRSTEDGVVVWTRDWHPEKTPHFDTWPVHCVNDTEGAEFHPFLDVHPEDIVLSKGMGQTDGYSGIEGVGKKGETLEGILEPRGKERVRGLVLGLATDFCVQATTLDILERFKDDKQVAIYLIRDAIRAVNLEKEAGDRAIAAMVEAGAIAKTSDEIRAELFGA